MPWNSDSFFNSLGSSLGSAVGAELLGGGTVNNNPNAIFRPWDFNGNGMAGQFDNTSRRYTFNATGPQREIQDSLFGLSQSNLGQAATMDPYQVGQSYYDHMQAMMSGGRSRSLASLRDNLFNTGRLGLGVNNNNSSIPGDVNPELLAFYTAIQEQDQGLAARSMMEGQNILNQYFQRGLGSLQGAQSINDQLLQAMRLSGEFGRSGRPEDDRNSNGSWIPTPTPAPNTGNVVADAIQQSQDNVGVTSGNPGLDIGGTSTGGVFSPTPAPSTIDFGGIADAAGGVGDAVGAVGDFLANPVSTVINGATDLFGSLFGDGQDLSGQAPGTDFGPPEIGGPDMGNPDTFPVSGYGGENDMVYAGTNWNAQAANQLVQMLSGAPDMIVNAAVAALEGGSSPEQVMQALSMYANAPSGWVAMGSGGAGNLMNPASSLGALDAIGQSNLGVDGGGQAMLFGSDWRNHLGIGNLEQEEV